MRVLHLTDTYLPQRTGGKEVFAHHMASALNRSGDHHRVALHAALSGQPEECEYMHENVPISVLPLLWNATPSLSAYTRLEDNPPGFKRLLELLKPDIVHFHDQSGGASLSHLRIVKEFGIKSLLTYHSPGQSCPQRALLRMGKIFCDGALIKARCTRCLLSNRGVPDVISIPLSRMSLCSDEQRLSASALARMLGMRHLVGFYMDSFAEFYQRVDGIQIHAKWIRDVLIRNGVGEEKIHYFPLNFHRPGFHPDDQPHYPDRRPLRLAYVGRCNEVKGVHILIEAVGQLDHSLPVEVHFFGPYWDDTPYGRSLMKRTAGDPRFIPPVLVPNEKIPEVLSAMDVCVIPSLWPETGPLTVYDAWNAGIPVIGTDMAGIAERVTHGENGLLFSRSDSVGLQECILRFFNEPALLKQMMQKIRRREPESDMALAMRGLYTQILNGKGGHF